jgi:DNA-binding LacI/PurR family transcriptional regulator
VAKAAGVSRTTVSFVLNDRPNHNIPEPTRTRVLAAAEQLGYTPHQAARALRRGRSNIVLFVLPAAPDIGFLVATAIDHLTDELAEHGLDLVVRRRRAGQAAQRVWDDIAPLAVLALESDDGEQALLREAGVVSILLGTLEGQVQIGALQVEHLAAAGHRHLACVVPREARFESYSRPRVEGARRACRALGLPDPHVLEIDLDLDQAQAAVQECRRQNPPVTAVCAYNDEYAFALLGALASTGLSVPEDLAVIGVDDVPLARLAVPPLSTVRMDVEGLRSELTRTLITAIGAGSSALEPVAVGMQVIQRRST